MHALLRPILIAAILAAVASLAPAAARAQPPIASYPGYDYSPGGYSGGYYYSPGYYPRARPAVAAPAPVYTPRPVSHVARRPKYVEDWSTGRTNYPLPLWKPWMRPLQ